jgi:hypothetical protein
MPGAESRATPDKVPSVRPMASPSPFPSSSSSSPPPPPTGLTEFLQKVAARLASTGRFGEIAVRTEAAGHRLSAAALASSAPAAYRLEWSEGRLWVALVTADRWLSQSIEQDLVHTGDKLDDLLEEELADLADGFPRALAAMDSWRPTFEHFRSEDLLFTFRTPLPGDALAALESELGIETGAMWVLGYEATFRRLGDMESGGDEEG